MSQPANLNGFHLVTDDCLATSSTFTLPDGRKLGYAEYGSPTGTPILILHGMACSRLDGAYYHQVGLDLGARIIGIDRPGMGWATPHPNRTVLTFAKDVEDLTKHLGLGDYGVLGISGGGPSTLACAKALPSNLKAAAMVVALGPPDIGMKGAQLVNRIGYPYGFRFTPNFLKPLHTWFWRRDAYGRVDLTDEERFKMLMKQVETAKMHPKDKEVFKDENFIRIGLQSTRQGFEQGFDGVFEDGKLCCLDLGFKVEDIRPDLPIHLWYGKYDVNVPANHGIQLEKRLGSRAVLNLKDETHASVTANWKKQIIEDLLKAILDSPPTLQTTA